jgi:hypothetical protein
MPRCPDAPPERRNVRVDERGEAEEGGATKPFEPPSRLFSFLSDLEPSAFYFAHVLHLFFAYRQYQYLQYQLY